MKKYLLFFVLALSFNSFSQPANGSTAADFTLTDLNGNSHNLYTYLDEGKTVFIKFFACHCPSCWNYHNTGTLENLYQSYGPDGTDQIMVLMLEHDEYNPDAFTGQGGYTQGDWTAGNSIPMCDVEWPNRGVFDDYNLTYYPMVIKVCPDKKTELMSTTQTTSELYQAADDCPGTLGVEENNSELKVTVDQINKQLNLSGFEDVSFIRLYSLGGKLIKELNTNQTTPDFSGISSGLHILQIGHSGGIFREKIFIE